MATTTRADATTQEEYLSLHRWMCMAKALDDRMHILVKQGRAPFVGSSRGHEGIQVASTAALTADDWLVPHYRGLANAIVRGLTMKEWMLAVFAKVDDPLSAGRNIPGGCYSYRKLKIAPVSQVVASWIPKAAGIAYAAKLKAENTVTLCTFGDGATSQGEFHEGVNFAAVHKLPVVFVCENNGYAISVPIRLQMANPDIADRAAGYGIPGVTIDGTDVPACYKASRDAVARARRGDGPTLIDAKIWRINAHTSEDNHLKYRSKEELDDAAGHDPITRFEAWLTERGWITPAAAAELRSACDREASDAADWAEQQPDPLPGDALKHVFASSAAQLRYNSTSRS
jgi:2-oxoisovalerate dehydrogenase E1 component alpha subunit